MYVIALATDYDETLADNGRVTDDTLAALKRFRETGRRLILVTGREIPDLKTTFFAFELFDRIVAENGAVLYEPATQRERDLAPSPSQALIERLQRERVQHLSVGRSIIATREPYEATVLNAVRELGLELDIVFNKGAVMILPSGVNKATGLAAALDELSLSAHNIVGIGDAENDHAFLQACGCGAAVTNALPAVRERAHLIMSQPRGAGVIELMDRIEREDGALMPAAQHGIAVGKRQDEDVFIPSNGRSVLIAGRSGIGKSTLVTALTEDMCEKRFQFCVFDPEGDYQDLEHAVTIGDAKTPPTPDAIFGVLEQAKTNPVINTLAVATKDRPNFFVQLLPRILAMRAATARPHWLIIDEAHHLLPQDRSDVTGAFPSDFTATIFVTVHPDAVARDALNSVDTVIALGDHAPEVIGAFCRTIGIAPPKLPPAPKNDEVLFWRRGEETVLSVKPRRAVQAHKRHTRKYAQGELSEEESFYFRGPHGKLNLRAQNTNLFLQIADGVDDATWQHHLRAGEYSRWFRDMIKDSELADEVAEIEQDRGLSPGASRERVKEAVNRRYTAPAKGPTGLVEQH